MSSDLISSRRSPRATMGSRPVSARVRSRWGVSTVGEASVGGAFDADDLTIGVEVGAVRVGAERVAAAGGR